MSRGADISALLELDMQKNDVIYAKQKAVDDYVKDLNNTIRLALYPYFKNLNSPEMLRIRSKEDFDDQVAIIFLSHQKYCCF